MRRRERRFARDLLIEAGDAGAGVRAFEVGVEEGCRLVLVSRAAIPSFSAFAESTRLWREELLAYFDQPITNGYAEGVINEVDPGVVEV
jgi:hypothetical protein